MTFKTENGKNAIPIIGKKENLISFGCANGVRSYSGTYLMDANKAREIAQALMKAAEEIERKS